MDFLADRILEFPLSLFAVSVGTAALPALSSLWSHGDREGMSEASLHSLRLSLFMAIPCAAGIYIMAIPIVRTLFEHGRFSAHDTEMTASIIRIYGLGVIFATGVRVLAPAFYAMKNTWLPALAAAVALVSHVFIASILMKRNGVVGLAASSVLSGGINFLFIVLAYQVFIARLKWRKLGFALLKFVLASGGLMVAALIHDPIAKILGDSHLARVVSLGVSIGFAAAVYFALSWLLNVEEFVETVSEFKSRIQRKLKKPT